jgi:DNA repair exonuclease SbcCD nuclease subunit
MQNLAESYPERVPHLLNIGLLHTSINGREGHEPYAPCSLDLLKSKGYDYWALGHVHAREVVCDAPWVVFPGNLQGRHAREMGEKGATLVHYDESGVRSIEARALDVVRYATSSIDLGDVTSFDETLDRVRIGLGRELERSEGRTIGVRIILIGRTALHARLASDDGFTEQCRALALDLGGEEIFVEKSIVRTSAPAADSGGGEGPLAELLAAIARTRGDARSLSELANELSELRPRLPPELREGEDALRWEEPEFLASQLDVIEQLLISRLGEWGER